MVDALCRASSWPTSDLAEPKLQGRKSYHQYLRPRRTLFLASVSYASRDFRLKGGSVDFSYVQNITGAGRILEFPLLFLSRPSCLPDNKQAIPRILRVSILYRLERTWWSLSIKMKCCIRTHVRSFLLHGKFWCRMSQSDDLDQIVQRLTPREKFHALSLPLLPKCRAWISNIGDGLIIYQ